MFEYDVPDPLYFIELGYDKSPGSGEKHYRYLLKTPLEKSIFIDPSPFHCYDLWRGQNRGNDSFFSFGSTESTLKKVGKFKGILKCLDEKYRFSDIGMA